MIRSVCLISDVKIKSKNKINNPYYSSEVVYRVRKPAPNKLVFKQLIFKTYGYTFCVNNDIHD